MPRNNLQLTDEQSTAILELRLAVLNAEKCADARNLATRVMRVLGSNNVLLLSLYWNETGLEQIEKKVGIPQRSAKAVISAVATCLVGVIRELSDG